MYAVFFQSKILSRFINCFSLFKIELKNLDAGAAKERFILKNVGQEDVNYFKNISSPQERGMTYADVIALRLNTPDEFLGLAVIDKQEDKLAYSCWIRTRPFFEDKLKEEIKLKKDECYFFDAYAVPQYRGMGLHKFMMIKRIEHALQMNFKAAFITVECTNSRALSVIGQLAFDKVKTKVIYKKGSIFFYSKRLVEKLLNR